MRDSAFQELLSEFVLEARERTDEVEGLLLRLESAERGARGGILAQAKRELHTLKGNSGMMGFTDLQQLAHAMEDRVESLHLDDPDLGGVLANLDRFRRELEGHAPKTAVAATPVPDEGEEEGDEGRARDLAGASVRVPFARLDRLVEMLAETVIFRNRLSDAIGRGLGHGRRLGIETEAALAQAAVDWEDVERAHQALEKTLNALQEQVTELGMVPLQSLFRRLGRIVHDEAAREGKRAELEIQGGETPLDKTLLEAAAEALGHLVRNAVVHGIESPGERRRRGKPETGRIRVEASLAASQVRIEVLDDGGGIDAEELAAKAGDRELASPYDLLFEEGFSTRGRAADLSAGRGVGLSAVRKTVESHGGRVEVRSQPGRGSAFALRLPVTASILRSLLVGADGESYALPLGAVAETLVIDPGALHEVGGAIVVRWRGRLVPILDLGAAFATAKGVRRSGYVVLIEVNGRYRGLASDEILGIRDIVVKGLDSVVGQPAGIAGSTILGDGRVILILDPSALTSLPPTPVSGDARRTGGSGARSGAKRAGAIEER